MELIKPSCSAVRPNVSPSWGRIPARIAKVKAVVISARQLALNKALRLMVWVIDECFWILGCVKQRFETHQNRKKIIHSFPV